MSEGDRSFPPLIKELHKLEFDYADGEGIDFEPFSDFLSADETRKWIGAWTGNKTLDGSEYLVFGQDGTGGYAALWRIRTNAKLLDQPVVFFGSEGEIGVVASNFGAYLWLLAGGVGPFEAVAYPEEERPANVGFTAFAKKHAPAFAATPREIISRARAEFPDFEKDVFALCTYT